MSPKDRLHDDGPRLLLTEGINDCHAIAALCETHRLPNGLFVFHACGGSTEALKRLNGSLGRNLDYQAVGIVMDADEPDPATRWQQLRGLAELQRYALPETPGSGGTIVTGPEDFPRIGIWLMPNNRDAGMLEDFLVQLAPEDGIAAAREYIARVRGQPFATFKEAHTSKAVIHTYLAWQDEPGKPLGQAITSHALRPETDIALRFTDWLRRLFGAG